MTPAEFRALRTALSLTQAGLAARLGLPHPREGGRVSVTRYETGTRPISSRVAAHLRLLAVAACAAPDTVV